MSALGAAWLAGLAVGVWRDLDALARLPDRTRSLRAVDAARVERDARYAGWTRRRSTRAQPPFTQREGGPMARIDELRLLAKVARMYHGDGSAPVQITERLNIHQSTVSRLLKRAEKEGIVRITFTMPSGLHPGARRCAAVDLRSARSDRRRRDRPEDQIARDLGAAAAFYLETTLKAARRRRHLVVERGASGDGRSDAPESARRRRPRRPDSRRHRQPGRGSCTRPI